MCIAHWNTNLGGVLGKNAQLAGKKPIHHYHSFCYTADNNPINRIEEGFSTLQGILKHYQFLEKNFYTMPMLSFLTKHAYSIQCQTPCHANNQFFWYYLRSIKQIQFCSRFSVLEHCYIITAHLMHSNIQRNQILIALDNWLCFCS